MINIFRRKKTIEFPVQNIYPYREIGQKKVVKALYSDSLKGPLYMNLGNSGWIEKDGIFYLETGNVFISDKELTDVVVGDIVKAKVGGLKKLPKNNWHEYEPGEFYHKKLDVAKVPALIDYEIIDESILKKDPKGFEYYRKLFDVDFKFLIESLPEKTAFHPLYEIACGNLDRIEVAKTKIRTPEELKNATDEKISHIKQRYEVTDNAIMDMCSKVK